MVIFCRDTSPARNTRKRLARAGMISERMCGKGYEIASHSITHATMPGMDEANIRYELEKSKEEIRNQLGEKYTFSAEVPYGYEDDRVMQIAYKIYPALRNRMPEPFLKEIDRSSRMLPHPTDKDYVQWQRGPLQQNAADADEILGGYALVPTRTCGWCWFSTALTAWAGSGPRSPNWKNTSTI
jgi:peptidoglycan/xylan/chitin deacetylase (PgdA/CDA1 family)